jgi:hypothetical protein
MPLTYLLPARSAREMWDQAHAVRGQHEFSSDPTIVQPVCRDTDLEGEYTACGACHGDAATANPLPKPPHFAVTTCYTCHPGVVDQNQKIADKTKHVNGKLTKYGPEVTDW